MTIKDRFYQVVTLIMCLATMSIVLNDDHKSLLPEYEKTIEDQNRYIKYLEDRLETERSNLAKEIEYELRNNR